MGKGEHEGWWCVVSETKGNFFYLHNEIFALKLPPSAFMVYCFLQKSANRKTKQCYPSLETICSAVGLSKNTVQKAIRILADKGLIFTENTTVTTKDGRRLNGTLRYTMLDPCPVIEAHRQVSLYQLELQTAYAKAQHCGAAPTVPVGQA